VSIRYVAVNWNRQKRVYDTVVALAVPGLVALFFFATQFTHPNLTAETGLIRGLGLTALILLHVILCIGPLCRLDPAFLPLLYNRRHLGVAMCLTAVAHAGFAVFQYHALGDRNPVVSMLVSNTAFGSIAGFPFELLGLLALVILVLMAATSHDFWLSVLSPPVWKALHMMVYVAYALLVGHVALGAMQAETGIVGPLSLGAGAALVIGLHLAAGFRERAHERESGAEEWVEVCRADEIPEERAKVAVVEGERVAVFRYEGKVSAISNVCRHQNGPLGEGRIVDGCVTCPWHGYQYRPDTGTSPPPFDDRVPTYNIKVEAGRVLVHRKANPAGTRVEPARVPVGRSHVEGVGRIVGQAPPPFYIGYVPHAPPPLARHTRAAVLSIGLLAGGTVVALAVAQEPFVDATFEYGHPQAFTGLVRADPYPMLDVGGRRFLLAGVGKHGALPAVTPVLDRTARILGTRAMRGNTAILEVESVTPMDAPTNGPERTRSDLGSFTLSGEIVDSKCWTGVMNPGEGKTHLSCAVRCLSGGLTPLFTVRDEMGRERTLILTDERGGPMPRSMLPMVGRPVSVTGRVIRDADLFFFHAAPSAVRVLSR